MELIGSQIIRNEVNKNAMGGTELSALSLFERLPKDLMENFQIIHGRVRELHDDKIRIWTIHDTAYDPECRKIADNIFYSKFHKIVYVSNWQYDIFRKVLNLKYSEKDIVIENGISPMPLIQNKATDTIHLIYASTPQRGLGILVPVFDALYRNRKDIHLHVFSSFKIYGWDQMDNEYEQLFKVCEDHPGITYYGYQDYSVLRQQMANCHILAYPSIWEETSCRVLIEAMSAGLLCVHPNYGALPDTSGGLNIMYQGDSDPNKHAQIFINVLNQTIDKIKQGNIDNYLNFVKNYTDTRFNIDKIAKQWEFMMIDLLNQYPTVESRKQNKAILTF
jgi:UDP-glucose:(glucosyl)LPS alpha-1,2-glucosyltransferase